MDLKVDTPESNMATMKKATVGIRELKDKASSIIDRVEEGEARSQEPRRPGAPTGDRCVGADAQGPTSDPSPAQSGP